MENYRTEASRDIATFVGNYIRFRGVAPGLGDIFATFGFEKTMASLPYIMLLMRSGVVRSFVNPGKAQFAIAEKN